jgi:iron complex transport system substrate-binding protein
VVGYNETEDLLVLGLEPVGVLYDPPSFYPDFDYERVSNAAFELDLEKVLALDPDLILGIEWAAQEFYDELSHIAPTVMFPTHDFAQWQEDFLATAEVVGKTDQARAMLDEFDERIVTLRETYADVIPAYTMNFFRAQGGGGQFYLMGNGEFHDFFFDELGIRHPDQVESATTPGGEDTRITDLGLEQIPLLEADVIFKGVWGAIEKNGEGVFASDENSRGANEYTDQLAASPLWDNLTAVENDRVFDAPVEYWNEGRILAANLLLDDIEEALKSLADTT